MSQPLKGLPIGLQTFEDFHTRNGVYVDKTRYLYSMISATSKIYFLSRPRRFGKSLTLSTLEAIFTGKKELFSGLWIESANYEWEVYPIIRIDMSKIPHGEGEFSNALARDLARIGTSNGVTIPKNIPESELLIELILALHQKYKEKVVILIDEYDKPIIDHLTNRTLASKNREILRNFYGVLKGMDEYLRFVFLTGVTKFSQVSIFSGLNNLRDITLDSAFGTLCGYTQEELEQYFEPYFETFSQQQGLSLEETLKKFKYWYNGYSFGKNVDKVYNPYSTLNALSLNEFASKWFESGTPTFLIKLIQEREYDIPSLEDLSISSSDFGSFDIDKIEIKTLLVQTGYLTITDYDKEWDLYQLGFPNYEVKDGFYSHLIKHLSDVDQGQSRSLIRDMMLSLKNNDLDSFFKALMTFFANIPYELQTKADEKYYQSLFHSVMVLIGLKTQSEVHTNNRRIEAVIELKNAIYLFEFKIEMDATEKETLKKTAKEALKQIQTKGYRKKYEGHRKSIHEIGAVFDGKQRTIGAWMRE